MSQTRRAIRFCASLCIVGACASARAAEKPDAAKQKKPKRALTTHEQLLKQRGIAADTKGIAEFLRGLHPTEKQRRHARELVRRLGSGIFAERAAATRELAAMPRLPTEALNRAAAGTDPEVRWRAKKLLDARQLAHAPLLHAVFETVSSRKIPGLVSDLINAIPLCETPDLLQSARSAVIASARPGDAAALRSAIQHSNVQIQVAAVSALATALQQASRDDLKTILRPPKRDDGVVLAAARGLANLGERIALPSLVGLLASDAVLVRSQSAIVLRASTGRHFGFASYASPKSRAAVIGKWSTWVKTDGATAKLRFPLKLAPAYRSYLKGNTLLACGYKNKVIEFNPQWKAVWEYPVKGAFSAEKLYNGNVLIACYGPNEVIEVTREKKVVWRMKTKSCLNARLLSNGNILIAGHTSKQAIEVNRDKKTVWSHKSAGNCYDAHRLPNGNTLIASDRGVLEITPEQKTVWEYKTGQYCYGIQPLPSGNILLASYSRGQVLEINRAKETVWTYKTANAFDAFRLANGNTLVTTNSKHMEVTPDGKTLWSRSGNTHGRTRR